jgi:hypothetical protein
MPRVLLPWPPPGCGAPLPLLPQVPGTMTATSLLAVPQCCTDTSAPAMSSSQLTARSAHNQACVSHCEIHMCTMHNSMWRVAIQNERRWQLGVQFVPLLPKKCP